MAGPLGWLGGSVLHCRLHKKKLGISVNIKNSYRRVHLICASVYTLYVVKFEWCILVDDSQKNTPRRTRIAQAKMQPVLESPRPGVQDLLRWRHRCRLVSMRSSRYLPGVREEGPALTSYQLRPSLLFFFRSEDEWDTCLKNKFVSATLFFSRTGLPERKVCRVVGDGVSDCKVW